MSIPQTIDQYCTRHTDDTPQTRWRAVAVCQAVLAARSAESVSDPTPGQVAVAKDMAGELDEGDYTETYSLVLREARLNRARLIEWVQRQLQDVDRDEYLGAGLACVATYLTPPTHTVDEGATNE